MSELPGLFKIKAAYKPTAEIETFVGETGELFYNQDEKQLRISDGITPGGEPFVTDNPGGGGVSYDNIQGGEGIDTNVSNDILTISLSDALATPGIYGSGNSTPRITVDSKGRITDITSVPTLVDAVNITTLDPITLNGTTASINFAEYSIGVLNGYIIRDKISGEVIDLPARITDTEIIFSSKVDLSNFEIEISFISDTTPDEISAFSYDLSGTEYSIDVSGLGNQSFISFYVTDEQGNIVDVPTYISNTEFRLTSNVDLTDHRLYLITNG